MKKTLILISMVVISSMAMAQQGNWYIGGLAGFSSSKSTPNSGNETVNTTWNFAPEGGTFLKDDIQLGIALGLGGDKTKIGGNDNFKTSNLSPTIYGRKFFKITDSFSTFAGLYLDFINNKSTSYAPTVFETKTSGFGARIGIGVAYALSPRFTALGQYGLLGFKSTKDKDNGSEVGKDSSFNFGVNSTSGSVFNVGIYYTFIKP